MAGEWRGDADTEDMPSAQAAFEARGAGREDDPAGAVARTAALLALLPPRGMSDAAFASAAADAREQVDAITLTSAERPERPVAEELDALGPAGQRAARAIRELRRAPRPAGGDEDEELVVERALPGPLGPPSRPSVAWTRSLERPERERVESEQAAAAQSLLEGARTLAPGEDGGRTDPVARLVAASLLDPDPIVQAAAAGAALRWEPGNPLANAILDEAARFGEPETQQLARALLATDRRADTRRIEVENPPGSAVPRPDSVLIHGTWARRGDWWRPNGQLHQYLRNDPGLFPNLHGGAKAFEWSGYFSFRAWRSAKKDWSRTQAGGHLAWWAEKELVAPPDMIGHSYGASISLLATQLEKRVRGLVLLSPAVHHTCLPNSAYYDGIVSVVSRLDLVLLADGADPGLLRGLPNVTERRVRRKGITGHAHTHDPEVWEQSGLTAYVRDDWLPSLGPR